MSVAAWLFTNAETANMAIAPTVPARLGPERIPPVRPRHRLSSSFGVHAGKVAELFGLSQAVVARLLGRSLYFAAASASSLSNATLSAIA